MSEPITLSLDTHSVAYLCQKCKLFAKMAITIGPITYKLHDDDPYSFMIHEIIEQMLSVRASERIYNRLLQLCDGALTPGAVDSLTDKQIKSIGTASSKVNYIRSMTAAAKAGLIDPVKLSTLSDEEVLSSLLTIRGVGSWTAKMYMIFVLGRENVLPIEDVAFIQAFSWLYNSNRDDKSFIIDKCKEFEPYRSIAARFFYKALDSGLTKKPFVSNSIGGAIN